MSEVPPGIVGVEETEGNSQEMLEMVSFTKSLVVGKSSTLIGCKRLKNSMVVFGSLNTVVGDIYIYMYIYNHSIGQEYTTYIPLKNIANWLITCYIPPFLREPKKQPIKN